VAPLKMGPQRLKALSSLDLTVCLKAYPDTNLICTTGF